MALQEPILTKREGWRGVDVTLHMFIAASVQAVAYR